MSEGDYLHKYQLQELRDKGFAALADAVDKSRQLCGLTRKIHYSRPDLELIAAESYWKSVIDEMEGRLRPISSSRDFWAEMNLEAAQRKLAQLQGVTP